VPPEKRSALAAAGIQCNHIGEMQPGEAVQVVDEKGRELPAFHGYDHFS
jgi:thiamine monophosphate kinase